MVKPDSFAAKLLAGIALVEKERALAAAHGECGLGPLECGGECARPKGHEGDCRCGGDIDGTGCPA
ncbi:MAG TPA: hypothetical protein VLT61_13385 [Anaeromyxobacteraceae bacterium]|nr:hypothetical protein [Anaeromyxobacteraceae bacterium]